MKKTVPPAEAGRVAMRELVRAARARGEDHRGGPGGLLSPPRDPLRPAGLMLVRAIVMLLTRRRDVRDVEEPIPYSGPLVVMLSVVAVTDGIAAFVLHLLPPPSSAW